MLYTCGFSRAPMGLIACACRNVLLLVVLMTAASPSWANHHTPAESDAEQSNRPAVLAENEVKPDEPERKMFLDEPREMSGIVFGSIVVNLTLVTVFFGLLWREWKKHKVTRKSRADELGEG